MLVRCSFLLGHRLTRSHADGQPATFTTIPCRHDATNRKDLGHTSWKPCEFIFEASVVEWCAQQHLICYFLLEFIFTCFVCSGKQCSWIFHPRTERGAHKLRRCPLSAAEGLPSESSITNTLMVQSILGNSDT